MNLFNETLDEINAIEAEVEATRPVTIDQRIALVQAKAMLSVSQELSLIRHQGINPEFSADQD